MHNLGALSLVIVSGLAASGCAGANPDATSVPFSTVERSGTSAVTTPESFVVRSQTEFNALWARHTANRLPPPPAPAVDFKANQIVGYFLGWRPSGCYSMSISRVIQTSDRVIVTYKEDVPPPGAICTAMMVSPAHFVAVPQSRLPVEFAAE